MTDDNTKPDDGPLMVSLSRIGQSAVRSTPADLAALDRVVAHHRRRVRRRSRARLVGGALVGGVTFAGLVIVPRLSNEPSDDTSRSGVAVAVADPAVVYGLSYFDGPGRDGLDGEILKVTRYDALTGEALGDVDITKLLADPFLGALPAPDGRRVFSPVLQRRSSFRQWCRQTPLSFVDDAGRLTPLHPDLADGQLVEMSANGVLVVQRERCGQGGWGRRGSSWDLWSLDLSDADASPTRILAVDATVNPADRPAASGENGGVVDIYDQGPLHLAVSTDGAIVGVAVGGTAYESALQGEAPAWSFRRRSDPATELQIGGDCGEAKRVLLAPLLEDDGRYSVVRWCNNGMVTVDSGDVDEGVAPARPVVDVGASAEIVDAQLFRLDQGALGLTLHIVDDFTVFDRRFLIRGEQVQELPEIPEPDLAWRVVDLSMSPTQAKDLELQFGDVLFGYSIGGSADRPTDVASTSAMLDLLIQRRFGPPTESVILDSTLACRGRRIGKFRSIRWSNLTIVVEQTEAGERFDHLELVDGGPFVDLALAGRPAREIDAKWEDRRVPDDDGGPSRLDLSNGRIQLSVVDGWVRSAAGPFVC